jgi:hypothetical protein
MSLLHTKVAREGAASTKIFCFTAVTTAVLLFTGVALARHAYLVWVEGLIQRIEPRYREMAIWEYQGGRST